MYRNKNKLDLRREITIQVKAIDGGIDLDIQLKGLTMEFDGVQAVKSLSTTIKEGQLVSLLGPSGCGKSTTLMLLAGLYKPTSGQILFGDEDVTKIEAENRGIGMVFQNYALYPHLTVLKNIMFPLKMQKVPKKEAMERAMEMAKLVQIDHLVDRKPGQLSGGQQQRVAIARALVKKPRLLLLDEPLSNLDARLRLEMREEIRRIQLEVGITAIFVTHDQEEAMSISDKIMLMNGGELQQECGPQEMYRKPINTFAAKFIGSPPINMLEAVVQENNILKFTGTDLMIQVPENLEKDSKLTIGFRPENLFLTEEENAIFSGEITHIETIGRDTLIRIKNGSHTIRALIDSEAIVNKGDFCNVGIKAENIHYFDIDSGKRVTTK